MIKEISSLQHPLVKYLVHLRQNRDYREEHHSVVIEGRKMVDEICPRHHTKLIMTYDKTWIPKGIKSDEILIVNEAIMSKVSGLQNPEGILAEVDMPNPASLKGLHWIIALDGVSDPGNLGALIRTGLALGWEGVFILENSCDPFNEKALRAAKGATFRLPYALGTWDDLRKLIKNNKLKPFVADMNGTELHDVSTNSAALLVLSNEAHGLSEEAAEICKKVSIPMPGDMESLNVAVAGGILMYVLKQGKLCPSVG